MTAACLSCKIYFITLTILRIPPPFFICVFVMCLYVYACFCTSVSTRVWVHVYPLGPKADFRTILDYSEFTGMTSLPWQLVSEDPQSLLEFEVGHDTHQHFYVCFREFELWSSGLHGKRIH